MKRLILLILCLHFYVGSICAQNDSNEEPLKSSIMYKNGLMGNDFGRRTSPDINKYPNDLKEASFFYVEINKDEMHGNKGIMGPNHKKFNKKVISKMEKSLGDRFETFDNEHLFKSKNFFIDKGYKYRILIRANWKRYNGGEWKQNFYIMVEDIQTGTIYDGSKKWYWFGGFINQFLKECSN